MEQPLPPYGSCLLGSINLTKFVKKPFTPEVYFDWETFSEAVRVFTRMLDNVVEINGLPLEKQAEEIKRKRRHGMGYLGLGSAISLLGMKYGDEESILFTNDVSRQLALDGWRSALELAREKGPAPVMNESFTVTGAMLRQRPEMVKDGYKVGDVVPGRILHAKYSRYMQQIATLDPELVKELAEVGARFTHHSSIAPTGTISLSLANNASNGIEPSFAHHYARNVIRQGKKSKEKIDVFSYELLLYRKLVNPNAMPYSQDPANQLPDYFIAADDVTPKQHVDIQAVAQKWVDSSISKTANVPTDYPFEDFKSIYEYAYSMGLKGCFDIDSPINTVILANGENITLRTLFELGVGTKIRTSQFAVGMVEELYYNGIKDVYRYVFSNGVAIDCTDDHIYETPDGEFTIKEIHDRKLSVRSIINDKYGIGLPSLSALEENEFIVPATNTDGRYSISSKGRVWRHVFGRSQNNKPKWLSDNLTKGARYKRIKFTDNDGNKQQDNLHNFILNSLLPNQNEDLDEGNHFDGKKENNDIFNLERVTNGYNLHHRAVNELQSKSSSGYHGVHQTGPDCFLYSIAIKGNKLVKKKFHTAHAAAVERENYILENNLHKHPYYYVLNFDSSDQIDYETEKLEAHSFLENVSVVDRIYIGKREVCDLRISTSDDDHIYLVNGIRVHNCTTFRFNPEVFQGVLVKESDLENTTYQFTLEDGSILEVKGNEEIEYDGEIHTAANLFDSLKEGYYGKF